MAQLVKNSPATWETWVQFLGWEDPLEKRKATYSVFWPGRFHGLYSPWSQSQTLSDFHSHTKSLVPQLVKNPTCNAGDPGSIPGSGRSFLFTLGLTSVA